MWAKEILFPGKWGRNTELTMAGLVSNLRVAVFPLLEIPPGALCSPLIIYFTVQEAGIL